MANGTTVEKKTRQPSASLFPRHVAMVTAIRMERAVGTGKIQNFSEVVQDAIERLAREELGDARLAELREMAS